MPQSKEQHTEYMRKRREAQKLAEKDPLKHLRKPGYPKAPDPDAMDAVNPNSGRRYTSDGARMGDGLPDTNVLIGRMRQDDIDKILSKIDTHPTHGKGEKSRV